MALHAAVQVKWIIAVPHGEELINLPKEAAAARGLRMGV
jgi:hypothetical protein